MQDVHVVASMNPSTNVGRYQLSTRFTANVRLAYVSYPDKESLNSIYSALLAPVFAQQCKGSAVWDQPGAARKLAACMVDVWEATRKKFSVGDIGRCRGDIERYRGDEVEVGQLAEGLEI